MISERNKKFFLFGGIVLISFLGIFYNSVMSHSSQDYTVGKIVKIWKPLKGGKLVRFEYSVKDEHFEGDVQLHGFEHIAKVGSMFIVCFPEQYPYEGFMMLNHPVSDDLKPPKQGWDEIPDFLIKERK